MWLDVLSIIRLPVGFVHAHRCHCRQHCFLRMRLILLRLAPGTSGSRMTFHPFDNVGVGVGVGAVVGAGVSVGVDLSVGAFCIPLFTLAGRASAH